MSKRKQDACIEELATQQITYLSKTVASVATKYATELVGLKCAPMLLPLFPNFKEITESFAAFNAVRKYLKWSPQDTDITVLCVGDGSTPRTGATFALRTAWNVVSVDPNLQHNRNTRNIARLAVIADRVENTVTVGERVIIAAVHSHADLWKALATVKAREIAVVAIPCCVPQTLSTEPDFTYQDYACSSPERTVKVWKSC